MLWMMQQFKISIMVWGILFRMCGAFSKEQSVHWAVLSSKKCSTGEHPEGQPEAAFTGRGVRKKETAKLA